MDTKNLPLLKIHKLSKAQYERELAAGRIDENALYLTPDEDQDLSNYATKEYVKTSVADIVNSAPEALDTLGELAIALENHEDAYDALLETVGSKSTTEDLENLKTEISESIVSETDEFHIVDNVGNIVATIDASGITTTNVAAKTIIVNNVDLEELIQAKAQTYVDEAILGGAW